LDVEAALHQIIRQGMGMVAVGGALILFALFASQPGGGHSTGNPPTGAGLPLLPQFRVDSGYAISPFAHGMNLLHFSREHRVMAFARVGGPSLPSEGSTFRDVQHPAHHIQSELLPMRLDKLEPHQLSFAKRATAFFRTSRS